MTGRVFRPGSAGMLAECVIGLLRDPEVGRKAGLAGRRRIEEMFPLDGMVRRHEDLYDAILSRRKPSSATPTIGEGS